MILSTLVVLCSVIMRSIYLVTYMEEIIFTLMLVIKVMSALKNKRSRKPFDDSSVVSLTDGRTSDRWTRESPRRALQERQKQNNVIMSSPKSSKNNPTVSKTKRTNLRFSNSVRKQIFYFIFIYFRNLNF